MEWGGASLQEVSCSAFP